MDVRPCLLVSGCLLGQKLRFNGEGKRQSWVTEILAPHVEFFSVCPEVAMGLSVPRESLRLVQAQNARLPRLIGNSSGQDFTERATVKSSQLAQLAATKCHGVILAGGSPTCGPERVKVYPEQLDTRSQDSQGSQVQPPDATVKGVPRREGQGVFAAAVAQALPLVPVISSGRLADPSQVQGFLTAVYTWARFSQLERTPQALQAFHRRHKFLLMALSPSHARKLGNVAALFPSRGVGNPDAHWQGYAVLLSQTLKQPWRRGRFVAALEHVYGFVKERLQQGEKEFVVNAIAGYRRGEMSLYSCLKVLHFISTSHGNDYLLSQALFEPFPHHIAVQNFCV